MTATPSRTAADVIRRVIRGELIEEIEIEPNITDSQMIDALFIAKIACQCSGNVLAVADIDDAMDFVLSKQTLHQPCEDQVDAEN